MAGTAGCPTWCLGNHAPDVEHHSARATVGDLLIELIQEQDDDRVVLSVLESYDGGGYFLLPMAVVPLIATTALRLVAAVVPTPTAHDESRTSASVIPGLPPDDLGG